MAAHQSPTGPRDDRRGRRHLGEYDLRSRTTVTPLLLMRSLDRIEALMRAGTADAFQNAQQELRAMAKLMREGGARTEREAARREKLLELLDLIERRVDGMAAKHANAAAGFSPFKAAAMRRNASSGEGFAGPSATRVHAEQHKGAFAVEDRPTKIEVTSRLTDHDASVPSAMEADRDPLCAPREAAHERIDAPTKVMPKTSHSVTERMAASDILPVLAELTEEERLALFT